MQVGSLVQWQVAYNDDPDIIKDAGFGVIVATKSVNDPFSDLKYNLFEVYRNKFNDIITISENYLSLKE
jgi:hypothetical protein